jgi:hypothetical protein
MNCSALRHRDIAKATTRVQTRLGNTQGTFYMSEMKNVGKVIMIGLGVLSGIAILAVGVLFYVVSYVDQPKYALAVLTAIKYGKDPQSMIGDVEPVVSQAGSA